MQTYEDRVDVGRVLIRYTDITPAKDAAGRLRSARRPPTQRCDPAGKPDPDTTWQQHIRDRLDAVWERDGEIVVDKSNKQIAECGSKRRLRTVTRT